MKNLFHGFLITLTAFALAGLGSCKDNVADPFDRPIVGEILPATDAAGTVKVLEGESVTLTGRNLGLISRVVLGQHEREARITEHTAEKLVFTVPMLPELVDDAPRAVSVTTFDLDGAVTMEKDYFLTSNGTGFYAQSASAGDNATIGSTVTVLGRALEKATRIQLTGAVERTIEKSGFTVSSDGSTIAFAIPDGDYPSGANSFEVTVSDAEIEFKCENPVRFLIPTFDPLIASDTPFAFGQVFTIKGSGLNVISSLSFGATELTILSNDGTTIEAQFPFDGEEQNPVIITIDIVAHYGTPQRTVTVATGLKFDTTFVDTVPKIASITSSNGDDRFFLNNEVTLTGELLLNIAGLKLGDLTVEIKQGRTDSQMKFDMPQGYEFTTATDLSLMMEYQNKLVEIGRIKVYPFIYVKGLRLGIHSNSSGTASEDGETASFTVLTHGKTYSSLELFGHGDVEPVVPDRFAWNRTTLAKVGTTGAMKTNGKLDPEVITSSADYYSVAPYIFACTNSGSQIRITGSGSGSQSNYRYIRRLNSATSFSQWITNDAFGASPVYFRVMTPGGTNAKWQQAVVNNTLETVLGYDGTTATSGDLVIAGGPDAEGENNWVKGSVILAQYMTYEWSAGDGAVNDLSPADVYQSGFIHITDLTCVNEDYLAFDNGRPDANGTARRTGHITFDLYWPVNHK